MDARDLQFLDNTFSAATSFFTLMYIPGSDHAKVFDEVLRVLEPGGPFSSGMPPYRYAPGGNRTSPCSHSP